MMMFVVIVAFLALASQCVVNFAQVKLNALVRVGLELIAARLALLEAKEFRARAVILEERLTGTDNSESPDSKEAGKGQN